MRKRGIKIAFGIIAAVVVIGAAVLLTIMGNSDTDRTVSDPIATVKEVPEQMDINLFTTDFEGDIPGETPLKSATISGWTKLKENDSSLLYCRVAKVDDSQVLHIYCGEGGTKGEPRANRDIMVQDIYKTIVIEFRVKTYGANSAVSYMDTEETYNLLWSGASEGAWSDVKLELDLGSMTYAAYVNGAPSGEGGELKDLPSTSSVRFTAGSVKPGCGIYLDDIRIFAPDVSTKDIILLGNQEVNWANVKPDNALSDNSFVNNLTDHPRILVDDWDEIHKKVESSYEMNQIYSRLIAAADTYLLTEPMEYALSETGSILGAARGGAKRIMSLAFAYGMTREEKYLNKCYEEMIIMGQWPDWSAFSYYLCTGELLYGYACAYDWIYDGLTTQQKADIYTIIKDKALAGLVYNYEGQLTVYNFTTSSINWNPVCNTGALAAAIVFAEQDPQVSEYIIERAPMFMRNALAPYGPEGAYPEGVSYWDLGTSYLVYAMDILDGAFVDDFAIPEEFNFYNEPGIAETVDFPIYYTGPTGKFNYGDSSTGMTSCDILYWMADKFDKPQYAWYQNNVQKATGKYLTGYSAISALCFYNPDNVTVEPGTFTLDKFYGVDKTVEDRVLSGMAMRSTWEGDDALYGAMQGGVNGENHMHYSLGTYVIDYNGQRFITVDRNRQYGMSVSKSAVYYRRAEGYNTLIVNPTVEADQKITGVATLIASGSSDNTAFGVLDMTDVYDGFGVISAKRGMMMTDNRSRIIIQDEVQAEAPSEYYWFAATGADIKIAEDGKSALLEINSERMLVRIIEGPEDAKFEIMGYDSIFPEDIINIEDAGSKLAIHISGVTELNLAVEYIGLEDGEGVPESWTFVPMDQWTAQDNALTTVASAGGAVVVKAESPYAISKGKKLLLNIDKRDSNPYAVEVDGVIYVPSDFVADSFTDVSVRFTGKKYVVSYAGESLMLDGNEDGWIPLTDELIALLGKTKIATEDGLLVITDEGVTYTDTVLDRLEDELGIRIQLDGKDLEFFELDREHYAISIKSTKSIPSITVIGAEAEITQASALGDTATVKMNGKTYTFEMQADAFENVVGNHDKGVLYELKALADMIELPPEPTYIYVEALEDSTGWATYPERGIVDGVINEKVENRWASSDYGCWIMMDFGEAYNLHSMGFAGVDQDIRTYKFEVCVSADGQNWVTVHTDGAAATEEIMTLIELADNAATQDVKDALKNVRYVKILGKGYVGGVWNTYAEVRFYENHEQEQQDMFYWPVYFSADFEGKPGDTLQINLKGTDYIGRDVDLSDAEITYSIANEHYASVTEDGYLTFLREGSTTITIIATKDGFSARSRVDVICSGGDGEIVSPGGDPNATYTVSFTDMNGNVISEGTYDANSAVSAPEMEQTVISGDYIYNFAGWGPNFSKTAVADAVYAPVYQRTKLLFMDDFEDDTTDAVPNKAEWSLDTDDNDGRVLVKKLASGAQSDNLALYIHRTKSYSGSEAYDGKTHGATPRAKLQLALPEGYDKLVIEFDIYTDEGLYASLGVKGGNGVFSGKSENGWSHVKLEIDLNGNVTTVSDVTNKADAASGNIITDKLIYRFNGGRMQDAGGVYIDNVIFRAVDLLNTN